MLVLGNTCIKNILWFVINYCDIKDLAFTSTYCVVVLLVCILHTDQWFALYAGIGQTADYSVENAIIIIVCAHAVKYVDFKNDVSLNYITYCACFVNKFPTHTNTISFQHKLTDFLESDHSLHAFPCFCWLCLHYSCMCRNAYETCHCNTNAWIIIRFN